MVIEYRGGDGRVDPDDLAHQVRQLRAENQEILRRQAIYEKRILVLEGKRQAGRADDMREIARLVPRETGETGETETETENETGETEPWVKAGVSKATWYRRQKEGLE
jgi:hypothetical protein